QHRLPFAQTSSFSAKEPLELLHGDLCGPISPSTPSGKRYFLLLVDDYSRFMWLTLLNSKDEAFSAFKTVKTNVELELGFKVKGLWTDRGGEFTSKEFQSYCNLEGIKRYLVAPYSPQQNGVVERRNQTVIGMTRSMLKSKGCTDYGVAAG
ncbi:DDE-type integrase/transposase/recombinase, partial [Klebsiella pneumoniae]|uniref:DDE-type integrase/transposase/recombinase n=1 Tax=Klebsiella pneumoniae TaxID=573 RepID=UPI00193A93DB